MKLLGLFLLASSLIYGQETSDLPDNVIGAGMGYTSITSQKTSGWFAVGHKTGDKVYTLFVHDTDGISTSERVDIEYLLARWKNFLIFGKGGAGVSTGTNALGNTNLGASFAGGGSLAYDISKLVKRNNVYAVATYTVVKNNVNEQVTRTLFQRFGEQGVFRFGVVFSIAKGN